MAFGLVEGNKLINYTLSQTRVTVIGRPIGTDGKTADQNMYIYSALIGKPDEGFNPPVGTILARTADMNDLYGHDGQFVGTTLGNYTMQERTASLSFVNDFVYLSKSKLAREISRNTLLAMLAGETFRDGSNLVKVYGTTGNYKSDFKATSNCEFKYLFMEDGRLVVPQSWDVETGTVVTKANSRATAYSTGSLCVMIETLTEFDSSNKEGFRWVYTLPGNITLTENMDFNKISMDCMFLSDARFIDSFWVEGISTKEADGVITSNTGTALDGKTNMKKIVVADIVSNLDDTAIQALVGTTSVGIGTCYVASDNGKIYVGKTTSSWVTTGTVGVGCLINSNKIYSNPNYYDKQWIAVKTAGALSGAAVAADLNAQFTGVIAEGAPLQYVITAKDFDYNATNLDAENDPTFSLIKTASDGSAYTS